MNIQAIDLSVHSRAFGFALSASDIHTWLLSLHRSPAQLRVLERTLASDELERANRFHFAKHRDYFVAGRGLMRTILGRYLDEQPDRIRFGYGVYGKPFLVQTGTEACIHFNLSHSKGLALLAISQGQGIGVDLEYMRKFSDMTQVAERFFAQREYAEFLAVPPDDRVRAFYNCWTRKEAFLKATGDGMAQPLDSFAVSLVPGEPARLVSIEGDPIRANFWTIVELATASPGYQAALAYQGQGGKIRCMKEMDYASFD